MMENILIKDSKFEGKYVALRDISDRTPVADGKNPELVYTLAVKRGVKNPLLLYAPKQGMVQIYAHSLVEFPNETI